MKNLHKLSILSFVLLVTFLGKNTFAADYYWVRGVNVNSSGNWSDLTRWSNTSGGPGSVYLAVPTASDNVFFDANSFTSAGQTLTIDPTQVSCLNMDWSGVTNTPTFSCTSGKQLLISGSLTFSAAMTLSFAGEVRFVSTAAGRNINTNGKSFGGIITFNGVGGGWVLQNNFTTTGAITLSNGTFNTNNFALGGATFTSNSGTARSLILGSSTLTFTAYTPAFWNVTSANFTLNAGTSTIRSTGFFGGFSPTFNGGNLTYHNLIFANVSAQPGTVNGNNTFNDITFSSPDPGYTGTLNGNNTIRDVVFLGNGSVTGSNTMRNLTFNRTGSIGAGTNTFTGDVTFLQTGNITGNNTFNNLTFTPGYTYTLTSGRTQTINGTLNATGNCGAFITIRSNTTAATTINRPLGGQTLSFLYLNYVTASPASWTADNSIDNGNNTGWTINSPAAKNLYWIGNGGNWSDGNRWSLTSGGLPSGCAPTSLDNVFFDANSFSLAGQNVIINVPSANCNNMDWTGMNRTTTFSSSNALNIFGSLTLVSNMTLSFGGTLNFEARSTGKTITSAGKSFGGAVNYNGIGGGWTLQDNFTTTGAITLSNGTLNTNNFSMGGATFASTSGTARSLILGSSTLTFTAYTPAFWNVTSANFTLNAGTSTIRSTGFFGGFSPTFTGGNLTYHNLIFANVSAQPGTVNGNNTFNDITFSSPDPGYTGTLNGNNTIRDVIFMGNGSVTGNNTMRNLTFTRTGSIGAGTNTFTGDVTFLQTGNITGNNTFNNLTFTPGYTYTLTSGRTQTINGTLNANGTCSATITIRSNTTAATTISKTSGSVTVSSVSLTWVTASGGATFVANNSVNGGNNSGWTINTGGASVNLYWIGNGGNWSDGNRWSTSSGGAPYGCAPGIGDNVFFDSNSFSLNGQTVTIDVPSANCNNMDWTGMNRSTTFSSTNTLNIYGSIKLVANMSLSFSGALNFEATSTGKTIDVAGKSFGGSVTFNGIAGEWTLLSNFATTSGIALNNGTLNSNNFSISGATFTSTSGSTRALNLGSSTLNFTAYTPAFWNVSSTNFTLNAGTSTIRSTGFFGGFSPTFNGGNLTYHNLIFANVSAQPGTVNGNNTFNDITFSSPDPGYTGTLNGNNTIRDVVFFGNGSVTGNNSIRNLTFHILGNIGSGSNVFTGDVTFMQHGNITSNNTFNNLNFTPAYTYTITNGRTLTINGNLNISGTGSFPVRIQSVAPGNQYIISKSSGIVCADYIWLSDSRAQGGATFNAGTNSLDMGGNSGWRFPGLSISPTSLNATETQLCNDGSQSSILSQTGGSLGNLAQWQWYSDAAYTVPVGSLINSADASLTVNPISTTTYYLRAEWPECIPPLPGPPSGITITVNPVPTIVTTGVVDLVCFNGGLQTSTLAYSASTNSPTTYSIDWTGITDQTSTAFAFSPGGGNIASVRIEAGSPAGSYTGAMTVTNAAGCSSEAPVSVEVVTNPNLSVINPDPVCAPVTIDLGDPAIVTDLNGATGTLSFFSTLTDANNNTNPISSQVETTGTYYIKKTTSEGCTDVNPVTVTVNICTITWYGTLSTQWDDGRNWNAAGVPGPIPTSSVNVFIPPATDVPFSPVIPAGVNGVCNNIYFYTGASLTIASGQILDVKGNWEAEAPLVIQGEGSVRFSRAIAGFQSIFGSTTFPNFISANLLSSLYIQSGMQTVTRVLQLATGALYGGGRITLASDASNTALIDDFSSGFTGSIVGNVTVRRHIAGSRGYRYLSNPINQSAGLTVLNFGPSVTGANGVIYDPNNPPGPTGFPTCWIYNENDANAVESQNPQSGWVSATTAATQLQSMKGYGVIINGTQTLSFTGPPNTGNFNISISYTSSGKAVSDGYNLIGNPYPSPVSWNAIRALPGNSGQITSIMKRWSNSGDYLGQYADWNGVVGTNGATDNIALGQAFFVKSLPGASSMVMQNSVRRSLPGASFFEEQPVEQPGNLLRLKISGEKGADEAVIYFDNEASDGYDENQDAMKLPGTQTGLPNIYTRAGENEFSINVLGKLDSKKEIPLEVIITDNGNHQLEVSELLNFDDQAKIYLEDRATGIFYNLRDVKRLNLNLIVGKHIGRYFIHLQPKSAFVTGIDVSKDFSGFHLYPNPVNDLLSLTMSINNHDVPQKLEIVDAAGRLVQQVVVSDPGSLIIPVQHLANGAYRLILTTKTGRFAKPFVVAH
jgi:hypothetical protein